MVSGLCSMPYHEVVRIIQHGFQPQAEATLFLDLRCPSALFKPYNKVCMSIIRYNIIHRLICNRYKYNKQQERTDKRVANS